MLTPEKIIALLNNIHEHVMARDIFVPVLRKMGLEGVRFTGGSEECGIDIEYYQLNQPDKTKSYSGIQFKKEDLRYSSGGAKGSVKEVKNQAEEAFEKELYDIDGRGVHHLTRFIVATTGDINEPARKYIGRAIVKGDGRQIHYWPGDRLVEYIQNNFMEEFEEYFADKIDSVPEEEEEKIVNSEYIEENYPRKIRKMEKVRNIVSKSEWEILTAVAKLEYFSQGSRIPMVDLLMEIERQEDYCKEDLNHLIDLQLLDIDETEMITLTGYASCLEDLIKTIGAEMDEADEEDTENTVVIFEEIVSV